MDTFKHMRKASDLEFLYLIKLNRKKEIVHVPDQPLFAGREQHLSGIEMHINSRIESESYSPPTLQSCNSSNVKSKIVLLGKLLWVSLIDTLWPDL